MRKIKRLLFFVPVIIGVVVVATMVKNKKEPNRPQVEERSRIVSTITVQPLAVVPRVTAYGYSEPTETWEAIPEVSGKIIEIDPELKKGVFYSKGDLLLRLDPASYGLAETRGVASITSLEAEIKELEQQKDNTERLITIEKESLNLSRKELERKRQLQRQGYLSQSELDVEEKSLLAQQTSLKNLQNQLALIPSKRKALMAKKDSDMSSLSEMQLDLERTVIRAPFDCRISEVNVELNEFAQVGSILLKAVNIDEVEIAVQLAPSEFVNLLSTPVDAEELFTGGVRMDRIREIIGITAEVRLPMFHREAVWEGTFRRTSESVDLETGALTAYISVKEPYKKMVPGIRPPLVPNLYCEVELRGHKRENRFLLPVRAVDEKGVKVVTSENRLASKQVTTEMVIGDFVVVSEGLKSGDRVVLTDLVPTIEGMLLDPAEDEEILAEINAFAAGVIDSATTE